MSNRNLCKKFLAGLAFAIAGFSTASAAPLFIGFGLGIIGSRFLLFFIKLSRHCQRGTSQSTFMLGFESGLALGLCLGFACLEARQEMILQTALAVTVAALLLYNFFTHRWFLCHKNR